MSITMLSEFLDSFTTPLHYKQPESSDKLWIFWKNYEESQNNSSPDLDDTGRIHEKIISAFSSMVPGWKFIAQFWAPVTIRGRWVLSTSGQPFAVSDLVKEFAKYKLYSEKYTYHIDVNKIDIDGDPMIIGGGHATAFLMRLPYMNQVEWIPSAEINWRTTRLNFSVILPICFPSQNYCIGVMEFTTDGWRYDLGLFVLDMITAVKKAGLDVFYVQDLIPYKTINGLNLAKNEIEEALKVICESHNLALAQVWIIYEKKSHALLSPLEDTQLLAIKLTGYLYAITKDQYDDFAPYFRLCDVIPCGIGEELALETLQDYESRYISKLRSDMLVDWESDFFSESSALAICLRSNDTGDFDYVFEFIWIKHSNYVIFLEALLLTLKRCLPRFKFTCGVDLGDELDVIVVQSATDDKTVETKRFKIFQGKKSSPIPKAPKEGKKPMALDHIAPSEVTCKTTPKVLPREVMRNNLEKP
ncbi:hypothetical protein HanIR_Chr13g0658011 [Helianthus annuus]|nr:hypothetical protein HanIR_Chr13g0658011 [Helianthus annuus]